jgi:superkiller protein 3
MMASKAALKAIKASIDSKDYSGAAEKATALVKQDPKNYGALLYQGFAYDHLDQVEQSEGAYNNANLLKPNDPQALKGLITLYEKHGGKKLDQYHDVTRALALLYAEGDVTQCQSVVDKYEGFARKYGTRSQYRHALELMLPASPLYDTLEARIPHPSHTYSRLLESAEAEEKEWINQQIGERRTRLGAKIDQVTQQVNSEAIKRFQVEAICQELINWTNDDELRRNLEEKTLQRAFDNLLVLPVSEKPAQRDKVLTLANGMVIIKHPFQIAWDIALEWVDAEDLRDWDPNLLWSYIEFFPDAGLSKVLRGYLGSESSVSSPMSEEAPIGYTNISSSPLAEADKLILMTEGLEDCTESLLAHRIVADTYLALDEHTSAMENGRKAQALHLQAIQRYSLHLQDSLDAVNITLATALITFQSPRHHVESKALFDEILVRKPTATAPLLGVGLVLEEDEDYGEAVKFLQRASERDPTNLRVLLELSWCQALHHDLNAGLDGLQHVLDEVETQKPINLSMKAEALYRIGYCKWHLDSSSKARKDKSGAYRYLIDAIKANASYAPAYTLLGIYFQDYGKSKQRARVALQKAFELSTSELEAAERLAKAFADASEWDLVELVAKRVVDSGKARPAPGSKKKAVSWPYAALGVVQMNKQQYSQAIVSLQGALRISPDDYYSWVGLGESYHNSGRYIAATRAFTKAESLDHGLPSEQTWFAKYMLANVQREMGSFDEAITEYETVLGTVENEFGVQIALLQTLAESAWAKIDLGMFGEAVNLAQRALKVAYQISQERLEVFNLWKAVGDACAVFAHAKACAGQLDTHLLVQLLELSRVPDNPMPLSDVDGLSLDDVINDLKSEPSAVVKSAAAMSASICAYKRAIHASSNDVHAQAVSWYNLGWAEHRAYVSSITKSKRFLKAAMCTFKRAIELEAGNAEFWNALGVVTMTLSPKVSQHSFVRSLHLNENSAKVWTNLGALYLQYNDHELANDAFTKAQSADPEYAHAWLGQGVLATLFGNTIEARGLLMHAFDIASSSSLPTKRLFGMSAFDYLIKSPAASQEATNILQPLLALQQLQTQAPTEIVFTHLSCLFAERSSDYAASISALTSVCEDAEAEYEKSESPDALARFAQAKADLARSQLAAGDYEDAITNSQISLDLSSEGDLGPASADGRAKWRLSSYVTAGLAHSYLGHTEKAIKDLQSALASSSSDPEITIILAQILWAKGDQDSRDAAQEQLFACVERYPDHVGAVTLLAVIGLLEDDEDVLEAVEDDLSKMRMSDKLSVAQKMKVAKVLSGIVTCKIGADDTAQLAEAAKAVMLAPAEPQGWSELAAVTGESYPSEMSLINAKGQVPPGGNLSAGVLATAYAGTGKRMDALLSIVIAPWEAGGYEALSQSFE